jgi:hypothetical protein
VCPVIKLQEQGLFILKIKVFTFVNNCFQNDHNAVIGVFLQALYENDDVKITYNLWAAHGSSSFWVYNKTNNHIAVDLTRTHLIINGVGHTYYQGRTYRVVDETSIASGSALAKNYNSSKVSTRYSEEKIEQQVLRIPPNAQKHVEGFDILNTIYRDCDLLRNPERDEKSEKKYTQETTPVAFRNHITYYTEEPETKPITLNHRFYISQITNYPGASFIGTRPKEFCGEQSIETEAFYKFRTPERFYIKYERTTGFTH